MIGFVTTFKIILIQKGGQVMKPIILIKICYVYKLHMVRTYVIQRDKK